MTQEASCAHNWQHSHIQYGEIGWEQSHQYEGDERIVKYREMWQVSRCTKCGTTNRESDRYYGDDMHRL